ncbi:MAG TPA: lysophospholipid acyltransferase family protein [Planctomycetaceae bacterium]|jgi:1-acyl-sn-glycerol-3-phosphate acyltransferase|nr:lysophospholipid acyltransferase family protein [Planctomycetaceae bacterium]
MVGVQANREQAHPESTTDENSLHHANPDPRNWLYHFLQTCLQLTMPVYFCFRARGLEHVPKQGPALFVANHQSFLDPVMVGIPLSRPLRFLARDTLFRQPLIGAFLRKVYTIPVNRDAASSTTIRTAASQLRQGFFIGIFPEGTRSTDGELGTLKPGFIALIRRADAPIIPVGVAGSGAAFPRGAWFFRPKKCRVVYGPPLQPEMLAQLKGHGSEQALLAVVREAMQRCYEEARAWQSR